MPSDIAPSLPRQRFYPTTLEITACGQDAGTFRTYHLSSGSNPSLKTTRYRSPCCQALYANTNTTQRTCLALERHRSGQRESRRKSVTGEASLQPEKPTAKNASRPDTNPAKTIGPQPPSSLTTLRNLANQTAHRVNGPNAKPRSLPPRKRPNSHLDAEVSRQALDATLHREDRVSPELVRVFLHLIGQPEVHPIREIIDLHHCHGRRLFQPRRPT